MFVHVTATESSSALPANIGRWQSVVRNAAKPVFNYLFDLQVEGMENVPSEGPAVLCPNHISVIDSFVLPVVLPRGITYVGKAEYLDDWKTAKLFPAMGMIPIDRRGGDHAQAALDAAKGVLENGGLFGIYPEGTRSRSGKLHKGRTGAARLAIETGAPIVPVGLVGTKEIQPPDQALPNPFRRATIRFGKPIDVRRYRGRLGDRAVYRELIDEVMFEIASLSGLDYEDTYAGAKAAPATEPAERKVDLTARELPAVVEPVSADPIPRRSSADVLKPRPLVAV